MKTQILKTEAAISFVKQTFAKELAQAMTLTPVSSPIMVMDDSGINDDLNGIERTVKFPVKFLKDETAVVVNSLAKWKRLRLAQLEVPQGEGILTDMRAIRPDEDLTSIHSIYVDQWDWEKVMEHAQRDQEFLKAEVRKIYSAIRRTELAVSRRFPEIEPVLPESITFVHAEDLCREFPTSSPKQREHEICKRHGAVFLIGIGGPLSDGQQHDGRAPDYDDWSTETSQGYFGLNGDILVWSPVLETSFELSSMGIRVDPKALLSQLGSRDAMSRVELPFHRLLMDGRLPQSIGGGIGQSRLSMFMLRKRHIGEVQVSLWPADLKAELAADGVSLL